MLFKAKKPNFFWHKKTPKSWIAFLQKKGKLRKIAKCTYQNSIAATVDTLFSSSCLLFPLECRMLADYISWPRTNFTTTVSSVGSKHRLEFWNWFKLKMEKKILFFRDSGFSSFVPIFQNCTYYRTILKTHLKRAQNWRGKWRNFFVNFQLKS